MATAFSYRSKPNASSESDSDDSDKECNDWKRATKRGTDDPDLEKIPIDPLTSELPRVLANSSQPPKRKRNNIWSNVLEDQMMSETLTHVGIKQKPKGYGSRGEESYDYTLGRKHHKGEDDEDYSDEESDDSETGSVASSASKVSEAKPRQKYKNTFVNKKFVKFPKLDGAEKAVAQKIVKTLNEQKAYLIFRVVKFAGTEKALELLKKTEDIEENGGMMIKNNARKRTPGGIYLHLVRSDPGVTKEMQDQIFEGEMNTYERKQMFDEKKRQKKIFKQKKALLRKLDEAYKSVEEADVKMKIEPKMEDSSASMEADTIKMETETIVKMEETPVKIEISNADLEDGEIDD